MADAGDVEVDDLPPHCSTSGSVSLSTSSSLPDLSSAAAAAGKEKKKKKVRPSRLGPVHTGTPATSRDCLQICVLASGVD